MARKKVKRVKKSTENDVEQDSGGEVPIESFESALASLEQIVSELEGGRLTLSESLAKYETGIRNLKTCHRILESAESRIRILTGIDADGNPRTEAFDDRPTGFDRVAGGSINGKPDSLNGQTGPDVADDLENDDLDDSVDDSDSLF